MLRRQKTLPFGEYDPLRVHPNLGNSAGADCKWRPRSQSWSNSSMWYKDCQESSSVIEVADICLAVPGADGDGWAAKAGRCWTKSSDIAILSLRYPLLRDTFSGKLALPPKWRDAPPLILSFHTDTCAIPHFCYVSRDNCAIPHKTRMKEFCDTIAASIAREEKYRCWASKIIGQKLSQLPKKSTWRNFA